MCGFQVAFTGEGAALRALCLLRELFEITAQIPIGWVHSSFIVSIRSPPPPLPTHPDTYAFIKLGDYARL